MRGWHQSDGAQKRDLEQSIGGRIFARYGAAALIGLVAVACAAQDDGSDMPGGGHSNGGSSTGGSSMGGSSTGGSAGTSGNTNGGSGAGTTSTTAGSAGKGGTPSGGSGNGGSDDGGKGGMSLGGGGATSGGAGGTAGSMGGGGTGGTSGGAGGKGGSGGGGAAGMAGTGGTSGNAGMGGNAGSGGAAVDACMNKAKDANEADVDCGGVCATKCATDKGCKTLSDCVTSDVCDASTCRAVGCANGTCAYALTRFIIGSGAKGQAVVSWDNDSLDIDFLIEDATPFDDSALNWQDDSVEVYLDLNSSKKAPYDTDDFQITIPRNAGALSGGTGGGNLNFGAIVVSNRVSDAKGYSLTVSIPYSALNGAGDQTGKTIGFDLAVNDDTNGGDTREAQSMLYGGINNYQDTSLFGTLTLTP